MSAKLKTLFKYKGADKDSVCFYPDNTTDKVSNNEIWASNDIAIFLNINEKFTKVLVPGKRYVMTIEEDIFQPLQDMIEL